ncbi:MAG: flagellar hook capping FlgD N-terminal domain-containing protein [Pseudomonadota bacterium]
MSGGADLVTGAEPEAEASALSDLDDFLGLLTAQLRNQDPLNPQDGTEFVEQIATFTGVEQQINTNTRLDELISLQTQNALSDLAVWVGRSVSAEGRSIDYAGGQATLASPSANGADSVAVVIQDQNGTEIARLPADGQGGAVTWDGALSEGGVATPGIYNVVYAFTNDTPQGPQVRFETPDSEGRVVEARIGASGNTELVLEGGLLVVDPAQVRSIVDTGPAAAATNGGVSGVVDAVDSVADTVAAVTDAVTG